MNFKDVKGKGFSGIIIWSLGSDIVAFEDAVDFYLGAETSEGYLDGGSGPDETYEDIENVLNELFKDHVFEYDLSENCHAVYVNKGETREQLLKIVRERLSSTNAIEKEGI